MIILYDFLAFILSLGLDNQCFETMSDVQDIKKQFKDLSPTDHYLVDAACGVIAERDADAASLSSSSSWGHHNPARFFFNFQGGSKL